MLQRLPSLAVLPRREVYASATGWSTLRTGTNTYK